VAENLLGGRLRCLWHLRDYSIRSRKSVVAFSHGFSQVANFLGKREEGRGKREEDETEARGVLAYDASIKTRKPRGVQRAHKGEGLRDDRGSSAEWNKKRRRTCLGLGISGADYRAALGTLCLLGKQRRGDKSTASPYLTSVTRSGIRRAHAARFLTSERESRQSYELILADAPRLRPTLPAAGWGGCAGKRREGGRRQG